MRGAGIVEEVENQITPPAGGHLHGEQPAMNMNIPTTVTATVGEVPDERWS